VPESILQKIRVADFSQIWAGPYATLLLAFMGAEVIKIESDKRPDPSRLRSITINRRFEGKDESPIYHDLNLNKLDVRIDLSRPKGKEMARRVIAISDVVVQNFRPGVMDRLGLGYKAVREVKPDIIYLSSSSVGATGPERNYGGYAPCFAALGGLAEVTGYRDGEPNTMTARTDIMSGVTSAFAILAALVYRSQTGKGQYIDLSSTESISVLIGDVFMDYAMNGRNQTRNGNHDGIMAPHNCYRCQGDDNWISIAIGTDEEWRSFCETIGKLEWMEDERFADGHQRWNNQEELDRLVSEWTSQRNDYEVMEILQSAGVAAMPSFNASQLYSDPHLKIRDFATEVMHPVIGRQVVQSPPWKLSATPAKVQRHSPLFGEHNQYVFGELLGMSAEEIAALETEKVLY